MREQNWALGRGILVRLQPHVQDVVRFSILEDLVLSTQYPTEALYFTKFISRRRPTKN